MDLTENDYTFFSFYKFLLAKRLSIHETGLENDIFCIYKEESVPTQL